MLSSNMRNCEGCLNKYPVSYRCCGDCYTKPQDRRTVRFCDEVKVKLIPVMDKKKPFVHALHAYDDSDDDTDTDDDCSYDEKKHTLTQEEIRVSRITPISFDSILLPQGTWPATVAGYMSGEATWQVTVAGYMGGKFSHYCKKRHYKGAWVARANGIITNLKVRRRRFLDGMFQE